MHLKKKIVLISISITTFLVFLLINGSSCFAKIYHIDPQSGNSGNDGSVLSPFKSWSDLPKMNNGDDVFFKCETKYYPSNGLNITWEGNNADPVEIGAYYLDGSKVIYGVKGNRPIISGNGHKIPENLCFGSKNSWGGMIQINSKDFIQIKDLHIYQSGNQGILIAGDLDKGTNAANFLIKNVKVEDSYGPGILVNKNPLNYGVIEECEVMGSGYSWKSGCEKDWPVSLVVFSSPYSHTTIRKNYVHENWGEGIGSGRVDCVPNTANSGFVTIEDNIVWSNRRVDVYISRTEHNIVRRNILAGSSEKKYASVFDEQRGWNQAGIGLAVENRGDCQSTNHSNYVYDNFIAGHYRGIGVGSGYDSGEMNNIYIFNNTAVANKYNYSFGGLEKYQTRNLVFKNNVSFCPENTDCKDVERDLDWIGKKISLSHNSWKKQPLYWGGDNDKTTDNKWKKISGWQSLLSVPEKSDFLPLAGNVCLGSGTSMNNMYFSSASLLDQIKKEISSVSTWNIGAGLKNQTSPVEYSAFPAPKLEILKN